MTCSQTPRRAALPAALALTLLAVPAAGSEPSTFQFSCSNIGFAYEGRQPALTATCLTEEGGPNATSLVLTGISNQNGELSPGDGESSFQQSCGNIQILVQATDVTLSAICRTADGRPLETSLPLYGIVNRNGSLSR